MDVSRCTDVDLFRPFWLDFRDFVMTGVISEYGSRRYDLLGLDIIDVFEDYLL